MLISFILIKMLITSSLFDNLELTLLFQNILIKSSLMCVFVCVCVCVVFFPRNILFLVSLEMQYKN